LSYGRPLPIAPGTSGQCFSFDTTTICGCILNQTKTPPSGSPEAGSVGFCEEPRCAALDHRSTSEPSFAGRSCRPAKPPMTAILRAFAETMPDLAQATPRADTAIAGAFSGCAGRILVIISFEPNSSWSRVLASGRGFYAHGLSKSSAAAPISTTS